MQYLNRLITRNKIEIIIKQKLPTNNISWSENFAGEFCQKFNEFVDILLKIFQKIEEEEIFPNSFYDGNITLISKTEKDITKKHENYRQYSW